MREGKRGQKREETPSDSLSPERCPHLKPLHHFSALHFTAFPAMHKCNFWHRAGAQIYHYVTFSQLLTGHVWNEEKTM